MLRFSFSQVIGLTLALGLLVNACSQAEQSGTIQGTVLLPPDIHIAATPREAKVSIEDGMYITVPEGYEAPLYGPE